MDEGFAAEFAAQVNDDLNTPRALALAWDLVKNDLPAPARKATLLHFDRVLGLRLAEWQPAATYVPDGILALVQQRQQARAAKRWQDADALRDHIVAAGYRVEDTPQGPQLRATGAR